MNFCNTNTCTFIRKKPFELVCCYCVAMKKWDLEERRETMGDVLRLAKSLRFAQGRTVGNSRMIVFRSKKSANAVLSNGNLPLYTQEHIHHWHVSSSFTQIQQLPLPQLSFGFHTFSIALGIALGSSFLAYRIGTSNFQQRRRHQQWHYQARRGSSS